MTGVPDVSVIVAVYNTMPYLTTCLTSLIQQSIGLGRMEIIAVDDGSTDGSGKEIDRFAALYPGTVRVVHQANSGGPAAPSNRALDMAAGRYVYFVGADDHLGPEALERLVNAADEYGSDVVLGRMVGVGGRWVQAFKTTEPDAGLDSNLAWSLSNCKLFRREMVERHGLRFPEDMPVGSDQPFTIEACVRARRVSVLADYDYYYAVRRGDASNITYRTSLRTHLECGVKMLRFAAEFLKAGPERDAVLTRHFGLELAKIVGERFLQEERAEQEAFCTVIGRLMDEYLTDTIRDRINVSKRVRLALAQRGEVDLLREVITMQTEEVGPPIVIEGDRAYVAYPGFRDERIGLLDACFAAGENLTKRIAKGVETTSVAWDGDAAGRRYLAVTARAGLVGPSALDPSAIRVVLAPLTGKKASGPRRHRHEDRAAEPVQCVEREPLPGGIEVRARIPVDSLVTTLLSGTPRLSVRLDVTVSGTTYEIPLAARGVIRQVRHWRRGRAYRVSPIADVNGRLVVAVAPIRPTRVVKQRLRRLTAGAGGTP